MSPLQILQRKATFASDILTMYDTVCPGMTKERGLTLFEIFSATFQMIKLQASSIMNGVTDDASNSGAVRLLLKLVSIPKIGQKDFILTKHSIHFCIFRKNSEWEKCFYEPRKETRNGRRTE